MLSGHSIFIFSVRALLFTAILLALSGCKKEEQVAAFKPNTGQIQVLNGCGKGGAAEQFRNFLTDQGFDIIEFGNAPSWNYSRTIVVARTANEPVARDLAKVLQTDNLIHLFDPLAMVDATVFIGRDYEELIKRWQKPKI
jgi:CRISPR/Cas system-associated protein endoribonuclease Cas2